MLMVPSEHQMLPQVLVPSFSWNYRLIVAPDVIFNAGSIAFPIGMYTAPCCLESSSLICVRSWVLCPPLVA